ncbi:MAG: hemerythrin family protein, partial [Bacteroidota bacterium]|nr:hemerythrin family protein [Bacteroidota bacterium]
GGVTDKDISDVFFQLTHYYEQYMIREEINMKEIGYDKLESHREAHKNFINHIMSFREGYEKGEEDVCETMYFFLEKWFDKHMIVDDRNAVDYISGSRN